MNMALLPLSLSARCRLSLASAGIVTIGDIVAVNNPLDLLRIRNFSFSNLNELADLWLVDLG
jgi:DNA-directed RNA polymerase alpha subunit